MDIQDLVLFVFSMIGVLGFMVIFQWMRSKIILQIRVILELSWVFVVSTGAQIIGRLYFGAPQGQDFSRVFLYCCLGIIIYILARHYQEKQQRRTLNNS